MISRFRVAAFIALLGLLAPLLVGTGCRRKALTPPPNFLPDAPIVTGDEALDRRIAHAQAVAAMPDDDVAALRKKVEAGRASEAQLNLLVQYFLAKGNIVAALAMLESWAMATGFAERPMATYLDLCLGTEHVEDGIAAVDQYLGKHDEHPYLLLIRGLLLTQYGQQRSAQEAYHRALRKITTLRGLTGALERLTGLQSSAAVPPGTVLDERRELLVSMTGDGVLGHVAARHLASYDVEQAAPDSRLLDLGGVKTEDVDAVFASRRDAFRHCQLMHKKGKEIPGGRLVLHLKIERDGSPGPMKRVRSTFDDEEVPACLEEQVRHLWFPPPRYGMAVVYEREFRMAAH